VSAEGWTDGQRQNYIPLPIPSAGDNKLLIEAKNTIICCLFFNSKYGRIKSVLGLLSLQFNIHEKFVSVLTARTIIT
jgi:hypothetical protein